MTRLRVSVLGAQPLLARAIFVLEKHARFARHTPELVLWLVHNTGSAENDIFFVQTNMPEQAPDWETAQGFFVSTRMTHVMG